MKRLLWYLVLPLVLLFSGAVAQAKSAPTNSVVPTDQTITGDYFTAAGTVDLAGTVTSDAYVAGGQITIDGTIDGDLLVTGGTVTISGHVLGNIRALGGHLSISGQVDKNISVAGGNVELTSSSKVAGNVAATGGSVTLSGFVGGNVRAAAGTVTLSGTTTGNVEATLGNLHLTSKAAVGGNLVYHSRNDAVLDTGATVSGTVTKHTIAMRSDHSIKWPLKVIWLLSSLVSATLLLVLFPRWSKATATSIAARPWAAVGLGLATLILVPPVVILGLVTVIGLPVAVVLGVTYLVALYIAKFLAIVWVTTWTAIRFKFQLNWVVLALIGVIVYWLLGLVPVIGVLVSLAALLLGLGGITLGLFTPRQRAK